MAIAANATSLSDPPGSSALVDAARWVNDALLGTLATTIAVIAVAFIGFAMLSGRINWRKGLTVIFGCFLLFGARTIVGGLVPSGEAFTPTAITPPPPSNVPSKVDVYDPYAGAAPNREGD
ncbi:MAG: TrbC/VirB2 family protein [Sphingorhabdus sp.]